MNAVMGDVLGGGEIDCGGHATECALFKNPERNVDGNCYGVLLHKAGVAVHGFPSFARRYDGPRRSANVTIEDVRVRDIECTIREVVTLKKEGSAVSDSVGAIFQLLNKDSDGNYVTVRTAGGEDDPVTAYYHGNPVANAQLLVAKAIAQGEFEGEEHEAAPDVSRNGITMDLVAWAEMGQNGRLGD